MRKLFALALFLSVSPLWAANVYVAQSSAGGNTGADCTNARALSTLASGDWVAGNTIHLCGTITFTAGTAGLVAQGSGTSGSPIIVQFETNAVLQSPYFPGSSVGSCYDLSSCVAGIEIFNYNNIIVDGGTNGIVQNTANGTSLANHHSSMAMSLYGSNLIVRNLTIQNIYLNDASCHTETISNATNTNPIVLTFSPALPSGYGTEGASGQITGVGGNTAANTPYAWGLSSMTQTSAVMTGLAGNGNYTSGGTAVICDNGGTSTEGIVVVTGATNVKLCNNTLASMRNGVESGGSGTASPVWPSPSCSSNTFTTGQNYFGNSLTDQAWMMNLGGSGTPNTINVFNNHFLWTLNWADLNNDYHNDGLISYGPPVEVFVFGNVFTGQFAGTADVFCTYGVAGTGSSCVVFNNIFEQTGSRINQGVPIWLAISADYPLGPFYIANNTIVNYGSMIQLSGDAAVIPILENNLVTEGTTGNNYFYTKSYGSNNMPTVFTVADYNSFYGGRGYSFSGIGGYWCWPSTGGSPSGCGASYNGPWVNTGFDTHSISANPLLDANYHLQASSPDIAAGANLTSLCSTIAPLCYDAAGVARPASGAWDIGAYQYQPSVYRVLGSHTLGGGRTVQ